MITPDEIRMTCLTAIFSNSDLSSLLTLKGGNALKLLGITKRQSQDLDFSIAESKRLDKKIHGPIFFEAISTSFSNLGYKIINFKFEHRPSKRGEHTPPFWGGYSVTFTIISEEVFQQLNDTQKKNPGAYAESIENSQKKICIDLSFDEITDDRLQYNYDGIDIFIYSPMMIVDEKIRATCQQLPDYRVSSPKTRSRDLYDIYTTLTSKPEYFINIDYPENIVIIKKMFDIKQVPIDLIKQFINPSQELLERLELDYNSKVIPQIPSNERVAFNYLIEFNKKIFERVYLALQRS